MLSARNCRAKGELFQGSSQVPFPTIPPVVRVRCFRHGPSSAFVAGVKIGRRELCGLHKSGRKRCPADGAGLLIFLPARARQIAARHALGVEALGLLAPASVRPSNFGSRCAPLGRLWIRRSPRRSGGWARFPAVLEPEKDADRQDLGPCPGSAWGGRRRRRRGGRWRRSRKRSPRS